MHFPSDDKTPSLLAWGKMPLDIFTMQNPNSIKDKLTACDVLGMNQALPSHWIEGTYNLIKDCIDTADEIFVLQLDLHYPETMPQFSLDDTNGDFYLFAANVELLLKERSNTELLGWMGCREYDITTGKKFFHAVLFLDGRRIEGIGDKDYKGMSIVNRISQSWYSFTCGHTAYATVRAIQKDELRKTNWLLRNILSRLAVWNVKVKDEHDIVLFPEQYHKGDN